ncbi:hypothetical protein [Microbacterium pumilum]|uniref:DUF4878 domain-containing protein n=1 Tax=Microbacterium pumilum TaxID=344165 RepID=A0ABN2SVJ1_9MICO
MNRGAVIAIAAAAVVLVVAGGVTAWILTRPPGPEAVAERYLQALSDGDFGTIEGLLAERDEGLDAVGAALAGATGFISDYSFQIENESDAARTVRADVELDGEPAVVGFGLVQQDGGWKIDGDYLASLEAQTMIGDAVRVGGELFPAATPIPLLPAVYPVVAAPAGLVVGEGIAVVSNEAPVTVTIDATVSPDATARAQEQLDAYADACAAPADAVPANCGVRVPWAADLATLNSITFRIDAYPAVTIGDDGQTFAAVDGEIVATAQGTTRAGQPGTFTYRADDWALRGTVEFTGDEMVLAVR